MCTLEWKTRYNGTKPLNSVYSNKDIKHKYPYLLIDYYESKLKSIK